MKVLLTGATGYIGRRLLTVLLEQGHEVICCVRDRSRFSSIESAGGKLEVIEVDFLDPTGLSAIPKDIEVAYYLLHSMSNSSNYAALEKDCAQNFRTYMNQTEVEHVLYLSGIINEEKLSKHLSSRAIVEEELHRDTYACTTFRAGIIIGSGSASFEIIRDLVEKLPIMITPKWLLTKCQPIGVGDVISILSKGAKNPKVYNEQFDIGGPDVLSYKEMLLGLAKARGLKRRIWTVPVMTPRLSSYWLYFVTSTSFKLASALVSSMKVEVVCRDTRINEILDVVPAGYKTSLERALYKISKQDVPSSWKDAWGSGDLKVRVEQFEKVPEFGVFIDQRTKKYKDRGQTIDKIWSIGGDNGWYYGNFLWRIRGVLDKLWGGVGMRRGRTHPSNLNPGDPLDFWRVIKSDKEKGYLLLLAEMKLPGEAWLEFCLKDEQLIQKATFRPKGLLGRLYWFAVLPFHGFIFKGMLNKLTTA